MKRQWFAIAAFVFLIDAALAVDILAPKANAGWPSPSALTMETALWNYYTGGAPGMPPQTMFQPSTTCSPIDLGGGLFAYRIGRVSSPGRCNSDTGAQAMQPPYGFYATYEIWQNHFVIQQPYYATLAVNFVCMAAYQTYGHFTYNDAHAMCGGDAWPVLNAREFLYSTYFAGQPRWLP